MTMLVEAKGHFRLSFKQGKLLPAQIVVLNMTRHIVIYFSALTQQRSELITKVLQALVLSGKQAPQDWPSPQTCHQLECLRPQLSCLLYQRLHPLGEVFPSSCQKNWLKAEF